MEIDAKNNEMDAMKKNGEDKSLTTSTTVNLDDSIPKINPVKWTVNTTSNRALVTFGNNYFKNLKTIIFS